MVYTVLKTTFQKSEPKKLFYRDFKNFYYGIFANDLLENIDQIKKKAHSEKKNDDFAVTKNLTLTKLLRYEVMERSKLKNKVNQTAPFFYKQSKI